MYPYHIIDFRACVKHAYYGCSEKEFDCEKTGRKFATWQAGAGDFLTRYIRPILESGGSPREMLVVHDAGRDYRTGIYADYKGQKSKKDENKSPIEIEQCELLFKWAKKFFRALGATQIAVKGVEADDVIGWICQKVPGAKNVYTVDVDLVVLADDDTIVTLKNVPFFGKDGVMPEGHDLEGIPYRLISLAKSIVGDTSDNYGGVQGMGPAAIKKLLNDFGADGLEQLQEIVSTGNTTLLEEAIAESGHKGLIKLKDNFAAWNLGWKLANLKPDLCWKPRLKKLVKPLIDKRVPNAQMLFEALRAVDCDDMWDAEYAHLMPSPMAITALNWDEMKDAIFDEIKAGDLTAFDYESSNKKPIKAFHQASQSGENFVDMLSQELAGASFQFGRHLENVIYVPVDHAEAEKNADKSVIKEILAHAGKYTQRVAHNALFEGVVTKVNLDEWLKDIHDTRMMQRFYDENSEAGLKFMSLNYLGFEQVSYKDTLAAGNGGQGVSNMSELTLDEVFTYGTDDSLVTGHLHDLLKLLMMLDGSWEFYRQWAVKPTEVLQRSYVAGVNMNWALQRETHERDLKIIEEGMVALRAILLKSVTGSITPGCKSLIEAEKDYVFRTAKRKAEGDTDVAGTKLSEWKKKLEASCQYTPYRVEYVMPEFAFTMKQLEPAIAKLGLPALDKLTQKAVSQWVVDAGCDGFEDEWDLTVEQKSFVKALVEAVSLGCLKMSELRKKVSEQEEESESAEDVPSQAESNLRKAEQHLEAFGKVVQKLADVQPRVVEFGDPLNVGSPQQMQQLLYCKIGVPVRLRGKAPGKGRKAVGIDQAGPSTDEQAILTAFANDVPEECWQRDALKVLLKVKSATTRCSLYHDKYPLWRHRDGRIHPIVTDGGTDTLRPTASAVNILQVSKKDKVMRSMFIPPSADYVCAAIDFNGQEIRLMANLAGDNVMLSVYEPGNEKDLHSMTASGIAKMSYDEFVLAYKDENHPQHVLTQKLRKKAKTINFGMAYGAGPGTLSRQLIAPVEEAKQLLEQTFKLYSRIQPWQQETGRFMEKNGFTVTAFGTKRHATQDVFSPDNGKVSRQHRQGTNATIQGTAAQMLRIVLTKVADSGILDKLRMEFFAPIYDEVVAWVHKDDVHEYCQVLGKFMEDSTPPGHKIRQVPEFSIGPDWGRVHELGRDISEENVAKYVKLSLEEAKGIWEVDVQQPFNPILKRTVVEEDEDEEVEVEMAD